MIPIQVALLVVGLGMIALGLWLNHRWMESLGEYRHESHHASGKLAADQGAGLALMHTWCPIGLGIGAVALAAYLQFWVKF